MDPVSDLPLPPLNPLLKLYQGASGAREPSWSLHNPVSNAYFKIGWAEFECLARFPYVRTAGELKEKLERETTLRIGISEIADLINFLHRNGLLAATAPALPDAAPPPWWKKLFHNYLYFTLPLCQPEPFLKSTLPVVAPLLSRTFVSVMMILFVIAAFMTLQRADEFLHSFNNFLSLEGVLQGLIVLGLIKIVHELAHAYTAVKYGVAVPHMGVALIVMYPVLYTETTSSWQLSSRKQRFHIGVAGIVAELCLSAIFLLLWNAAPAGSLMQGLSFSVVAISLAGSLLINLNPLMRFDGYYMLSDLTGIENLQFRAVAFARHRIREILFGLKDDPPESVPESQARFMTGFGFALLIYRFFLFLGIAILVYHVFFKPLGLFLMLLELGWFIGLPVWSELKIWWQKRSRIAAMRRGRFAAAFLFACAALLVLPWQKAVTLPGVMYSESYVSIYPYAASYIEELLVREGESVTQGQTLVRLSSQELDRKIAMARTKVESLKRLQSRARTDARLMQDRYKDIDLELQLTEQELAGLISQQEKLVVIAPFDGVIKDLGPEIMAGRFVRKVDLLFRMIRPGAWQATGYLAESDLSRIEVGDKAIFIPGGAPFTAVDLRVKSVAATDVESIAWPELTAPYKGPLAAEPDSGGSRLVPLRSLYTVDLTLPTRPENLPDMVLSGEIRISGRRTSPALRFFRELGGMILRESGFN